ncbi:HAD-IA family hydrolase [Bifidobacterium parmae]|uniref:Haloacid dehalogenase-like hydrolase n=1 Tax=Bifidobacterium parmae TaxID=361854 RepID=A0A2N5J502_9BIFI|nr:HAD-IA family hydrolase [Bifidobacterium parmae]PLS29296.1 Haloacid dehalogenase-like hydrolase [Bifidobacterium parmae]
MSVSPVNRPVRPTYDDVIFDFCDVLVDWRPRAAVDGVVPADVADRLFDRDDPYGFWHYDELSDLGWSEERILADYAAHHAAERRGITPDAADAADAADAGEPGEPGEPGESSELAAFRTYFARQRLALTGMLPGMADLLCDLDAAGVRCWGLTNFTVTYVDAACELFPALGLLRDVVVSSAERIHKPDAAIYRRAVARFGVDPAHAAFVDDKQRNADAAAAAVPGLTGIRFTDAASLRARLFA